MSSKPYEEEAYAIIGTLQDGRTLARSRENFIVFTAPHYCEVSIPNLRTLDCILDINIRNVSPKALVYGICDKKVSYDARTGDVVVGFTVCNIATGITATGTTITTEVVTVGF